MKTYRYLIVIIIVLSISCTKSTNMDNAVASLKQIDIEFSNYSIEFGLNAAFLKYSHPEVVMLRAKSMPIEGYDNVAKLYSGDDSQIQLKWSPKYAKLSASGELGYTYGTYDLLKKTTNEHLYGTYITIWEKNNKGEWKMILDSGNEGI